MCSHWLTQIGWMVVAAVAVALSYFWADQQLVWWAYDQQFRQYRWLHDMQTLPEYFWHLTIVMLLGLGFALLFSAWRQGKGAAKAVASSRFSRFLAAWCFALGSSLAAKPLLKFFFSRTWPDTFKHDNPSLIRDGSFGFHWMQPITEGAAPVWYQSFPSGHTMAITAASVVLWHYWPKLRMLAIVMPIAVITGLLLLYYHYLGDVIAGLWFGCMFAQLAIYLEMRTSQRLGLNPIISASPA